MTLPDRVVRTGIPALDELIEGSSDSSKRSDERRPRIGQPVDRRRIPGFHVPHSKDGVAGTATFCLVGSDGTGKSAIAMHLASRFQADARQLDEAHRPRVIYVSTDLTFPIAERMWHNFALDRPNGRHVPFFPSVSRDPDDIRVTLSRFEPTSMTRLASFLVNEDAGTQEPHQTGASPELNHIVCFLDLASSTAGDDWSLISRLVTSLDPVRSPHLVVVDSVEGLETFSGEVDAFGVETTRRGRIARLVRACAGKCHLILLTEDPAEDVHLPEQFVADVVLRLRNATVRGYIRRTIELEKTRGQSHRRGQHPFTIRSGAGSTTGKTENPDDPFLPLHGSGVEAQSYVHVFPSLHMLSRGIMEESREPKTDAPGDKYAAFGVTYLDEMLEGQGPGEGQTTQNGKNGSDNRGLPWSSTTALIGDAGTQKTPLGYAFLARCFVGYANRLLQACQTMSHRAGSAHARRRIADLPLSALDKSDLADLADDERTPGDLACGLRDRGDACDLLADLVAGDDFCRNAAGFYLDTPMVDQGDGVPVLLTTTDIHHTQLAEKFVPWIVQDVPGFHRLSEPHQDAFRRVLRCRIRRFTVCRRFEVHDVNSPVLIHIVQSAVRQAQRWIMGPEQLDRATTRERFDSSGRIRLVIDDFSALKDIYADVRDDATFLPFLLFYLGREGVTGLIIDTHPGRPDFVSAEPLEGELRTLVHQRIYTWRLSFFGEHRVAIAAIPPVSQRLPALVRELSWHSEGDKNAVNPHFDMYTGLEEGRPTPVPLEVSLFSEAPSFERYVREEEVAFRRLFTPRETIIPERSGSILVSQGSEDYRALRDACHLLRDTRLDYTLVLQIDEFWGTEEEQSLGHDTRRARGALRPALHYLNAMTVDADGEHQSLVDPFGVFRQNNLVFCQSRPLRRRDFFDYPGCAEPNDERCVNRVPFTWDFGFLVYRRRPWELARKKGTTFLHEGSDKPVGDLEHGAAVSWREYLGACRAVAQAETLSKSQPVIPFDLSLLGPESLPSLLLEVWFSEIFTTKRLSDGEDQAKEWAAAIGTRGHRPSVGLANLVVDYTTELYMAWLLLVEVLPLPTFTEPERPYDLNRREANPAAVASRHWYKTASNISETATANEPIGVRSLPGHFATRGDWFLAVAEGSRSGVLADRALDLLSSPRANFVRLQMGLGLPTRRISSTAKQRAMRTALATFDEFGHRKGVTYEEIRRLGCEDRDNAWWLWRSSLKGYDRQARLWEKSVTRVLAIWNDVRRTELTRWVDCFLIYDSLAYVRAGNELPEWAVKLEDIRRFASRTQFERLMDFLYEQLAIAGELDGRKDARKKWAESLF